MTAANIRDFMRARCAALLPVACVLVFAVVAGAATAGNPGKGCDKSGNKPKKCNPAPAPTPPAPPPPPAPPAPNGATTDNSGAVPSNDDGTNHSGASSSGGEELDSSTGTTTGADPGSGSDSSSATSESEMPGASGPAATGAALQTSATPSAHAIDTAKAAVEPVVNAVHPPVSQAPTAAPPRGTSVDIDPAYASSIPALTPEQKLRRDWFAPNALVLLARDVRPGVHAIRAKHTGHASTFAVQVAHPLPTSSAHRPYRAGGWLRSDKSGVTVCVRALEVFKHRTIRTSESCFVAHRKWHRVLLKSETVAKGHRLLVSLYELGASSGDSFDVGGFRVSQS
jgi:hypothetical protein